MNRIILILVCLNFISCCGKTNKTNQDESDSIDSINVVSNPSPQPDIIELKSSLDTTEVKYQSDSSKLYDIESSGDTLLFTERRLKKSEIPLAKIKRKLEKKYQGWKLDKVFEVITNDTSFLKVEIHKKEISQNVYFTNDGKWFKIKPIEVSSTLDFNVIENNTMYKSANYKFHKPDKVYEMPDLLMEISGIVLSGEDIVYCVQDEIGSIFEYDLGKQEILNSYAFAYIGDFEDLTMNKNIVYVLRSDGNLFVYDLKSKTETYQTMLQINSLNIEGICFNDGSIYIACKDALFDDAETKRMIYRVNSNKLENIQPYLEIDITELSNFLTKNYTELRVTKFEFNPSSIAINPISKEMYILSASDRFIAIYKGKQLINVIPLSEDVYYQPEGLSFYQNGDLLISSEGDKSGFVKGTINLIKHE
jgi:hypothetical protein